MTKHAVINSVLFELNKLGLSANTFHGRTIVSNAGIHADYFGGVCESPFISPELEKIASDHDMHWEWVNSQELQLCSL